jgi:hypothetical protein
MNFVSKIKTVFAATAMFTAMTACDPQLAEVQPADRIDASAALSTSQGVQVMLTGAYAGMRDVDVWGGANQYISELVGDERELVFGGTFAGQDELWRKTMFPATNTPAEINWRDSYVAIDRANNVLSALDKVDSVQRRSVEGEARFVRGAVYFGLINNFAKTWGDGDNATNLGVPLVLTPTRGITDADKRDRSNVAAIYAQIITDLTRAEELLPATGGGGIRANKSVVAAFLAKVYLQQQNYTAARDAANRVITTNAYRLATDYNAIFNETGAGYGTEHVFRIFVSDQEPGNSLHTFFAPATVGGRGDLRVQAKFTNQFDTADVRGKYIVRAGAANFTRKYPDVFGDVPVIRISELFLIRAECNVRLGTNTGATPAADIAGIRRRAGVVEIATPTLADILRERRLELAFEGTRLYDLKRTRGSLTFGTETLQWNSTRLVLPISQREIDSNPKLVQNPGY